MPTLALDLRGAELRASCSAECDPERVQAIAAGNDGPLLGLYGNGLAPHDARLLLDSAVAPHVAAARPHSTMPHAAGLERLGFGKSQRSAPALVIPIWNVHGERATYQARPDTPRVKDGKPLKYETPAKTKMTLDVPPAVRRDLGNPAIPLFITEGARKADAAVSAGLCCIAVLGVWNWRGTNEWGGKTALPDWEPIAFKDAAGIGRPVYIAFDSDAMTKRSVFLALTRLKPFLESRGATVRVIMGVQFVIVEASIPPSWVIWYGAARPAIYCGVPTPRGRQWRASGRPARQSPTPGPPATPDSSSTQMVRSPSTLSFFVKYGLRNSSSWLDIPTDFLPRDEDQAIGLDVPGTDDEIGARVEISKGSEISRHTTADTSGVGRQSSGLKLSLVLLTQIQCFTSPCTCHEHLLMSSCAWRRRAPRRLGLGLDEREISSRAADERTLMTVGSDGAMVV